jgi:hypothetical protein
MQFQAYAVEERINPQGQRVGLIYMGLDRDGLSG